MSSHTTFAASGYVSADIQLFRDIADIDRLIGDFPVRQFSAAEEVPAVVAGDALLYIVLRGALRVSMHTPAYRAGGAAEVCSEVLPGECVGELSVLGGERRGVRITATQETDVLVIDAARLWALIHELDGFARKLLELRSSAIPAAGQQSGASRVHQPVIGLGNVLESRAWLDEHLGDMVHDAHAADKPLSMLMIGIDCIGDFMALFDRLTEDEAFQSVSEAIIESLRPSDVAVRYDEKRIAVVLPSANAQGATTVAQRLSARIINIIVFADRQESLPHIDASFGVTCLSPKQDAVDLAAAAAVALDQVKRT
jgi:diguanylate cyclase (GGDEF)-like protein